MTQSTKHPVLQAGSASFLISLKRNNAAIKLASPGNRSNPLEMSRKSTCCQKKNPNQPNKQKKKPNSNNPLQKSFELLQRRVNFTAV